MIPEIHTTVLSVADIPMISSIDREQKKLEKTLRFTCFGELRSDFEHYISSEMRVIVDDVRTQEFYSVKNILNSEGIDVGAMPTLKKDIGFMGRNLSHAYVSPVTNVYVTGVCFPEKPTLQSIVPLLAVKDLLDKDDNAVAYIAAPVLAYAGAGLDRREQYRQTVGIMQRLFGEKLGEQVTIIPDTSAYVMQIKYQAGNFLSRFVADGPAQQKYLFPNLFRYFETVTYGSDIIIAGLAERKPATVVADFRQFESIHAGIKMGKGLKRETGALLYTLVNPVMIDGKIREVSQDEDNFQKDTIGIPETSTLFNQAAVLFAEEGVRELYQKIRRGENVDNLQEHVAKTKQSLLYGAAATPSFITNLEEKSLQKLDGVSEQLFYGT